MKNLSFKSSQFGFLLIISCVFLFTTISCKKTKTGIDALPPATQEGKGTFGCLVNGEVFLPKGNFSNSPITCAYQYSSIEKGYYFILTIANIGNSYTNTLQLLTDSIKFDQNSIYKLQIHKLNSKGVAFARYVNSNNSNFKEDKYNTDGNSSGELQITKLDENQQIISGTFWFDAVNDRGEKVEVREGRFDVHYVK